MLNTMNLRLVALVLFGLTGCRQNSSAPQTTSGSAAEAGANTPHFEFSTVPAPQDMEGKASWCNESFAEPVVITPDPVNTNKRVIGLGGGVTKVVVNFGNMASSFFLRRSAQNVVEVFTSQNFPRCLSSQANFMLAADRRSFQYDNQQHIQYPVELSGAAGAPSIVLEFPPGSYYGLTAYRCDSCN